MFEARSNKKWSTCRYNVGSLNNFKNFVKCHIWHLIWFSSFIWSFSRVARINVFNSRFQLSIDICSVCSGVKQSCIQRWNFHQQSIAFKTPLILMAFLSCLRNNGRAIAWSNEAVSGMSNWWQNPWIRDLISRALI